MVASDFKHTAKVLAEFGQKIVENYKAELEACNYQDGQLYRTLNYSVKMDNSAWIISISLESYWKYIEDGRWPYGDGELQKKEGEAATKKNKYPPLDVIENWIKVRQIIPHSITLKSGKTVIPSIKQLSFLIARSISQKGIPARPFFKQSFEAAKQQFLKKITEAVQQDITDSIEGAIS